MAVESGIIALSGADVQTTSKDLFVVASNIERFRIDQATVTNYTNAGLSATLTVWILQSGETENDQMIAIDLKAIAKNQTFSLFEILGRTIEGTGILRGQASLDSTLSLSITGTNFT